MNKNILNILAHRIINMIISLVVAFSLIYFLVYSAPGKQFYYILNPNIDELLIQKMVSEQSLSTAVEFNEFVKKIFAGNLGFSTRYHQNISNLIFEHIQVTFILSITAFTLQFIISLFLAYVTLKHKGKLFDRIMDKSTSVLYSLPTIVTAPFLIILFSVVLKLFPTSGLSNFSGKSDFIDRIYYLTLPVLSLVLSFIPEYYKYLVEILENLSNQNFIVYLKSLSVSRLNIFFKHIVPNSMNTILSIIGVDLGLLLSGSLITEIIFGIPGFGRLTYEAIWTKDYYLAISCGMYGATIFILMNFITDILRVFIDKRAIASLR